MKISTKLSIAALSLLAVVATGIWVHEQGRPLVQPWELIHKLLGVATALYLGSIAYGLLRKGRPKKTAWFFVSLTALAIVGIVATGIMLTGSDLYAYLKWHNIFTVSAAVTGVVSLFVLIK